jgi:multidrug resistance protein, MATE family
MLSNVSEPLLGLVDTMVIGQLGEEGLIGAISIGAIIFSFLFWAFGFLRLSTAGFVAQANGARDHVEISAVLVRAMAIALVIGLLILVCQSWSRTLAFWWFSLQPSLEQQATTYYDIRIWSAPAAMVTYVVLGWLVGMQKTVYVMILQLTLNGINIILDIIFVSWFGWAVEGVAYATLIAQWVTLVLSLVLAYRLMPKVQLTRALLLNRDKFVVLLKANINIMLRTLCLIFAFADFSRQSEKLGVQVLDANSVLLHFTSLSAYALDGFAHAAEGLCGAAIGEKNKMKLRDAFYKTSLWCGVFSLLIAFAFWAGGPLIIDSLTSNQAIRETAKSYLFWAVLMSPLAFASFQLDGLFFAATRGAEIRNAMIVSLASYLAAVWLLLPLFGNHGLWLALAIFMVVRAAALAVYYPRIEASLSVSTSAGARPKA